MNKDKRQNGEGKARRLARTATLMFQELAARRSSRSYRAAECRQLFALSADKGLDGKERVVCAQGKSAESGPR
jgi:hypothetical protein